MASATPHFDLDPSRLARDDPHAMTEVQKRPTGLIAREIDGEYLILDTDADRVHQLNPSASRIWAGIERDLSARDIAQELAAEFDVDEDQALQDVIGAFEQFKVLKLVA